ELVEVGDGHLRAEAHAARIGGDFAEDELQERRLAAAVGSDQPDLVAAHDAAREILHHDLFAVALRNVLELGHEAPRTLARGNGDVDLSHALAPPRTLLAKRLEPAHAALVPGAPRLDALSDPRLF